jgi:hypothetical protein
MRDGEKEITKSAYLGVGKMHGPEAFDELYDEYGT